MECLGLFRPLQMAQSNYVSEYGPIKRMPRLNAPTERLLGRLSNSNYELSVSKHLQVRAPSLFVLTGLHLTKVKSLSDFLLYYGGSFQLHKHFKKFVYLNENPLIARWFSTSLLFVLLHLYEDRFMYSSESSVGHLLSPEQSKTPRYK